MKDHFLIYSPSEAEASDDNAGFWSNDLGWTTQLGATQFPDTQSNLPVATSVCWIAINDEEPRIRYRDAVMSLYERDPSVLTRYVLCGYERSDDQYESDDGNGNVDLDFVQRCAEQDYEDGQDAACYPGIWQAVNYVEPIEKAEVIVPAGMKQIIIQYSVLTRVEYAESLIVPEDMTDQELLEVSDQRYADLDGGSFTDDPDYWERGSTTINHDCAGMTPEAKLVRTAEGIKQEALT